MPSPFSAKPVRAQTNASRVKAHDGNLRNKFFRPLQHNIVIRLHVESN